MWGTLTRPVGILDIMRRYRTINMYSQLQGSSCRCCFVHHLTHPHQPTRLPAAAHPFTHATKQIQPLPPLFNRPPLPPSPRGSHTRAILFDSVTATATARYHAVTKIAPLDRRLRRPCLEAPGTKHLNPTRLESPSTGGPRRVISCTDIVCNCTVRHG